MASIPNDAKAILDLAVRTYRAELTNGAKSTAAKDLLQHSERLLSDWDSEIRVNANDLPEGVRWWQRMLQAYFSPDAVSFRSGVDGFRAAPIPYKIDTQHSKSLPKELQYHVSDCDYPGMVSKGKAVRIAWLNALNSSGFDEMAIADPSLSTFISVAGYFDDLMQPPLLTSIDRSDLRVIAQFLYTMHSLKETDIQESLNKLKPKRNGNPVLISETQVFGKANYVFPNLFRKGLFSKPQLIDPQVEQVVMKGKDSLKKVFLGIQNVSNPEYRRKFEVGALASLQKGLGGQGNDVFSKHALSEYSEMGNDAAIFYWIDRMVTQNALGGFLKSRESEGVFPAGLSETDFKSVLDQITNEMYALGRSIALLRDFRKKSHPDDKLIESFSTAIEQIGATINKK